MLSTFIEYDSSVLCPVVIVPDASILPSAAVAELVRNKNAHGHDRDLLFNKLGCARVLWEFFRFSVFVDAPWAFGYDSDGLAHHLILTSRRLCRLMRSSTWKPMYGSNNNVMA
ncbi:hypothetical protein PAXRUDRAFT_471169 [Paxillus rubicundulus Ve08.2h10]|uniref:Uncharacterized protein n=1 Tax=Paxillus rubicundulus Ve08.2h10 TaxID=930991 RepID=A0A0D0E1F7_9AGAM|nr:hypothetical protein PAXRUDRAFT_471169 [Paxillus rubicundulus Ve08.2h10]